MIKDIMCKNLIVVDINSNINDVSNVMKKYDIGLVVVVDKNKVSGVITDRDIVIRSISNNSNQIKDYISTNLISANINESIDEVFEKMQKNKVKRILIVDHNKLVGIISTSDIINSNIEKEKIICLLKNIFEISNLNNLKNCEIDEFYL